MRRGRQAEKRENIWTEGPCVVCAVSSGFIRYMYYHGNRVCSLPNPSLNVARAGVARSIIGCMAYLPLYWF